MKQKKKAKQNRHSLRMFNFLNVKPAAEKLTPENLYDFTIKKEYKKNQETVFWTVFISYMVFYFTRKQWTVFGSILIDDGTINKDQFALVGLIFAIAYGVTKFLSSPLSDTKSNKWLLGLGLIGAGVANILIGFCWLEVGNIVASLVLSCLLMVFLGWMHSFGAIPSTRFFYNWFNHKSRRNRITTWNVSINIGGALATFIIIGSHNLLPNFNNVGYFVLPSAISIVIGVGAILLIKDSPEVVGLPPLKEFYHLEMIGEKPKKMLGVGTTQNEDNKPFKYYFVQYILKNKFIWFLAGSTMLAYTLRMGISDWSLSYLKEVRGYDIKKEGKWIYSMFDWGGMVWTLVIGLLANKYLKRFIPLAMGIICLVTFALLGIWLTSNNDSVALLAFFMIVAGLIFTPQFLLPILATEFAHHRVVSTASGFLGIAGYAGDALMSKVVIGFGLTPPHASWNAVFIFLIVCGFASAALLIPMFNKKVSQ